MTGIIYKDNNGSFVARVYDLYSDNYTLYSVDKMLCNLLENDKQSKLLDKKGEMAAELVINYGEATIKNLHNINRNILIENIIYEG